MNKATRICSLGSLSLVATLLFLTILNEKNVPTQKRVGKQNEPITSKEENQCTQKQQGLFSWF